MEILYEKATPRNESNAPFQWNKLCTTVQRLNASYHSDEQKINVIRTGLFFYVILPLCWTQKRWISRSVRSATFSNGPKLNYRHSRSEVEKIFFHPRAVHWCMRHNVRLLIMIPDVESRFIMWRRRAVMRPLALLWGSSECLWPKLFKTWSIHNRLPAYRRHLIQITSKRFKPLQVSVRFCCQNHLIALLYQYFMQKE